MNSGRREVKWKIGEIDHQRKPGTKNNTKPDDKTKGGRMQFVSSLLPSRFPITMVKPSFLVLKRTRKCSIFGWEGLVEKMRLRVTSKRMTRARFKSSRVKRDNHWELKGFYFFTCHSPEMILWMTSMSMDMMSISFILFILLWLWPTSSDPPQSRGQSSWRSSGSCIRRRLELSRGLQHWLFGCCYGCCRRSQTAKWCFRRWF